MHALVLCLNVVGYDSEVCLYFLSYVAWKCWNFLKAAWFSCRAKYSAGHNGVHTFRSTQGVFETPRRSTQGKVSRVSASSADYEQDSTIFLSTQVFETFATSTNCEILLDSRVDEKR